MDIIPVPIETISDVHHVSDAVIIALLTILILLCRKNGQK